MDKNAFALSLIIASVMIQGTAEERIDSWNAYSPNTCSCNTCCSDACCGDTATLVPAALAIVSPIASHKSMHRLRMLYSRFL